MAQIKSKIKSKNKNEKYINILFIPKEIYTKLI